MQNLLNELRDLLQHEKHLVVDGKLLKNKIIELALQLDPSLINILIKHAKIKQHFFQDLGNILVFDKIKFQKFVSNKAFLPDSYTSLKNKIGLTANDEFISESKEVILSWPYKDCILEGGQNKKEQKRSEYFWNEILAPDEIDQLLKPKAFSKFTLINKDGEKEINKLPEGRTNFLIKGNNLLALSSLKNVYRNSIKLIYIDPPYNTGNDDFGYNDSFNHSSWLTFMKNRIEIAKDLLSNDGSIWINIDDDECHYLKVLCDQIFGRENFVSNIIWQKKYSPQNDAKWFSDMHDHILVYAKNKAVWRPNLLPRSDEMNNRYQNPDSDPRGVWKSSDLSVKTYSEANDYQISTPSGRIVNPPKSTCWRVSKDKFQEMVGENRIWFGPKGDSVPSIKRFLTEVKDGVTPQTIWTYAEVGHNQDARKEIKGLLIESDFSTPKPEKLLKRIIELGSNAGDIVLDFFAGSGTTAAVALKLNRHFIVCEQMDYIDTVTKTRLKKVIDGDDVGISKDVDWKGGGQFIYMEMTPLNQKFIDEINTCVSKQDLIKLFKKIKKEAIIDYRISGDEMLLDKELAILDLTDQKKLLVALLEKNQLYLNISEVDDKDYHVSSRDKELNKSFYANKHLQ